jgi:pyruvate formate lyase activating enzyme
MILVKDRKLTPTGIIFDLKKYAIRDGPGIRTTVFFKGCPLNCRWCHNPESRAREIEQLPVRIPVSQIPTGSRQTTVGCRVTVDSVMAEILQDRVFYDQSGGGVTFSGGEPLLQIDFLLALLQECRREGIHTAVDTSGYAPLTDLEQVCQGADMLLYDLKLMDDHLHREYVGVSNELILSNFRLAASRNACRIMARVPLIPGVTDTEENLTAVAEFLDQTDIRQVSLLPYNKLGEDKGERFGFRGHSLQMNVQDHQELVRKAGLFEARGFAVTVGG